MLFSNAKKGNNSEPAVQGLLKSWIVPQRIRALPTIVWALGCVDHWVVWRVEWVWVGRGQSLLTRRLCPTRHLFAVKPANTIQNSCSHSLPSFCSAASIAVFWPVSPCWSCSGLCVCHAPHPAPPLPTMVPICGSPLFSLKVIPSVTNNESLSPSFLPTDSFGLLLFLLPHVWSAPRPRLTDRPWGCVGALPGAPAGSSMAPESGCVLEMSAQVHWAPVCKGSANEPEEGWELANRAGSQQTDEV